MKPEEDSMIVPGAGSGGEKKDKRYYDKVHESFQQAFKETLAAAGVEEKSESGKRHSFATHCLSLVSKLDWVKTQIGCNGSDCQ
jgi:hypothetical protein